MARSAEPLTLLSARAPVSVGVGVIVEGQQRLLLAREERLDLRHLVEREGLPADVNAVLDEELLLQPVEGAR